MTNSSHDSVTSTSHTLSADPPQLPQTDLQSSSEPALLSTLSAHPHTFLQPPPSLHSAALVLAKRYLDPLASAVAAAQRQRQKDGRRKRKRGELDDNDTANPLQINKLYLDGFDTAQVWEQARRMLDAATDEVERNIPAILPGEVENDEVILPSGNAGSPSEAKTVRFDEDGFGVEATEDSERDEDDIATPEEDSADSQDGDSIQNEVISKEDESVPLEDEDDAQESDGMRDSDLDGSPFPEAKDVYVEDPNGLNDGFFSIDDFNKQSQFLERQDAAGDPDDGAASDEEDIDWDADPSTIIADVGSKKAQKTDEEMEDGSDEDDTEEGPTFGNMDLNAPEGASDDDMDVDEIGVDDNANEIYYKDFFEPPARKAGKKGKPSKHTLEVNAQRAAERKEKSKGQESANVQRTIDAVRRDIFEDDASDKSDANVSGDDSQDASNRNSKRSTHERNQAKLAEEIRKLEAANVAKREWTLMGEARASDRPLNSLLEEDLDFERAGKPVPVITAEVSEDIEELIKRRILAKDFDEVIRRRPDSLANPNDARRGRFELDDSKPQQSLAEMYEEEHLRKVDPDGHQDKRDAKLKKEHQEIELLWQDVSAKLDALSSWHYKPKPPKPSVNIVADVSTIAMEDARPTAAVGGGAALGGTSMLAPQEVYAPGKEKAAPGEVVLKSGMPVSKEEMTREEKLRRRRREKERAKKAAGEKEAAAKAKGRSAEKQAMLAQLKKGGVKVIGKKGELRDVEGKKAKAAPVRASGGALKL